jgi:uncharacterized protein YmfQ (DUF2313 family)
LTLLHSSEEHTRSLSAYLPNGKTFEGKNIADSNLNQLLRGLATELRTSEGYLITLEREYFPDNTTLYVVEWERALQIPDDCFPGNGTISVRRMHVLVKLASLGVQTADDFIDLALLFGKVVEVFPLSTEAFPPYPVPFTPVSLPEGRFTIVVAGGDIATSVPPYDVPFDLTGGESVMECLFKKLKPENCELIFRNTD